MDKIIVHGNKMCDREAAHQELKRAFDFPDFYGANLDALYDLLSERHEGQVIFKNVGMMLHYLGDYGVRLLVCLSAVAREHQNFSVEYK